MDYPMWLQIVLALSMSAALAGLGAWLFCTSAAKALTAARRLEDMRTRKETLALDSWKAAYEAEHEEHLADVAELTDRVLDLEKEIKLKDKILQKAKVKGL